jgi:aspartyl-tRNA(Asn)/glutamyl-tRNA(Gln) amidotransferase subunit A
MADQPWTDDASSLVDAFRAGERSPVEELATTLAAIARTDLNCFSFLDPERAVRAAEKADVSRPFGGVPIGVKELDSVAGWPATEASLVFKDRIATTTTTPVDRLIEDGGAVPVGLTTASEFGGLNVSMTKLNGVTHNPWRWGRTVGGSSSGSSAAVSGGLVSLATGGDGGGSIRIPSGYTGLLGMKGTYGRVARGPTTFFRPGTVVLGCLARSVRDAARHYDVCAGTDHRDPWSLPSAGTWERDLGTQDLAGRKVAVIPDLGGANLEDGVADRVRSAAGELIAATGMEQIDITVRPPNMAAQWMIGNLSTLLAELGDRWPGCADDLTEEVAIGLRLSEALYNLRTAAAAELLRTEANEVMATAFDQVDFIISATNPGPAFPADAAISSPSGGFIEWAKSSASAKVGFRAGMGAVRMVSGAFPKLPNRVLDEVVGRFPDLVAMGALTIISNIYGNPAVSIPAGQVDGLPIGMQVLAPHHHDALLFDVALAAERTMPWPKVAPSVTLVPTT